MAVVTPDSRCYTIISYSALRFSSSLLDDAGEHARSDSPKVYSHLSRPTSTLQKSMLQYRSQGLTSLRRLKAIWPSSYATSPSTDIMVQRQVVLCNLPPSIDLASKARGKAFSQRDGVRGLNVGFAKSAAERRYSRCQIVAHALGCQACGFCSMSMSSGSL